MDEIRKIHLQRNLDIMASDWNALKNLDEDTLEYQKRFKHFITFKAFLEKDLSYIAKTTKKDFMSTLSPKEYDSLPKDVQIHIYNHMDNENHIISILKSDMVYAEKMLIDSAPFPKKDAFYGGTIPPVNDQLAMSLIWLKPIAEKYYRTVKSAHMMLNSLHRAYSELLDYVSNKYDTVLTGQDLYNILKQNNFEPSETFLMKFNSTYIASAKETLQKMLIRDGTDKSILMLFWLSNNSRKALPPSEIIMISQANDKYLETTKNLIDVYGLDQLCIEIDRSINEDSMKTFEYLLDLHVKFSQESLDSSLIRVCDLPVEFEPTRFIKSLISHGAKVIYPDVIIMNCIESRNYDTLTYLLKNKICDLHSDNHSASCAISDAMKFSNSSALAIIIKYGRYTKSELEEIYHNFTIDRDMITNFPDKTINWLHAMVNAF